MKHLFTILIINLCCINLTYSQYKYQVNLTARDCVNCLEFSKAVNTLPYYFNTDIYIDGNLDSSELDYFVDTIMQLNREKFNIYKSTKVFKLEDFNVFTITLKNETLFNCKAQQITDYLDSIKNSYSNFKLCKSIQLPNSTILLRRSTIKFESNKIAFNNYLDGTVSINDENGISTIGANFQNADSIYKILFNDTAGLSQHNYIFAKTNIQSKPIQIDNYYILGDSTFILYKIYKSDINSSNKSGEISVSLKPYYFIGLYYKSNLKKIYTIEQYKLGGILDKDSHFIQSTISLYGVFTINKNELLLGVSNSNADMQKYYVARFQIDFDKNNYKFIGGLPMTVNPLLKGYNSSNKNDLNYSNFTFIKNNYLWFVRQNLCYSLSDNKWRILKCLMPKLTLETAKFSHKHFLYDAGVYNNKPFIIASNSEWNSNMGIYHIQYDIYMKQSKIIDVTKFFTYNKKCIPYFYENKVLVIENNKNIVEYVID